MNILFDHTPPPIYQTLHDRFGVDWNSIIITYAPVIYSPRPISPDKVRHETIHIFQQQHLTPSVWWDKYLQDPVFRLDQEVEAYRAEADYLRTSIKDRNLLDKYFRRLVSDLSSPTYGSIVTPAEARRLILN